MTPFYFSFPSKHNILLSLVILDWSYHVRISSYFSIVIKYGQTTGNRCHELRLFKRKEVLNGLVRAGKYETKVSLVLFFLSIYSSTVILVSYKNKPTDNSDLWGKVCEYMIAKRGVRAVVVSLTCVLACVSYFISDRHKRTNHDVHGFSKRCLNT